MTLSFAPDAIETWPLSRLAASTEMFTAFLSSRVLMTVPSRIRRTMSSSARLRAHQASQSTFTLRQARLTTMSHVAPLVSA